jgi:glycosyltransferase involved in cell wall biosynthesis
MIPKSCSEPHDRETNNKHSYKQAMMQHTMDSRGYDKNPIRIIFITPYFPPEIGAPQTRIYEQAVRLRSKGHMVSVLTTFPNYPSGIVPKEWKGRLFWKGSEQGVGVYRFWNYATPNSGFFRRTLSQLSFALLACIAALRLPPADVIIVESPPLFNGIAANFVGWLKQAPYLLHVSDLWPETAIQLGVLKNTILIWLAKRLEVLFYRRAAMVLAVTAGIRLSIAEEVGLAKVIMLRNAVDTEFFRPGVDGMNLRKSLGISDEQFLVLYAGTLGLSQQLDAALESAALFQKEDSAVHFVFAGDGAEKATLQHKAIEMKLSNVSFVAPYSKICMPQLLITADCVLVSLKDVPIFHAALPTKLFEAMACARPVVLAAAGEAETIVKESAAGCCARPGNPQSIHDAILKVQLHPDEAEDMGRRGREYMLANFSRERRVDELLMLLRRFAPQAISAGASPVEGSVKGA